MKKSPPKKEKTYKLLKWVDQSKLDWYQLCKNPYAIHYLENNISKIYDKPDCWRVLQGNPNAIPLLEKYPEKINWKSFNLLLNPNAIPLFEKNTDKIEKKHCWLSKNPNAISFLEKYPEKINWSDLCDNPNALSLIYENLLNKNNNYRSWYYLSKNPNTKIYKK